MSVDMQWNFMNPQNTMEADIAAKKARAAAQMQGYQTAPMNAAPQGYHPTMISQPSGQIAPDMEGYGKEMEAASAQLSGQMAREKKIGELESQISALEQSIAEKTSKLQNWTGNADKIAAIEASKINASDPTMIWRWNEARKDADRQAELNRIASKSREQIDNTTAQQKFQNTVDMLVNQRLDNSQEGREQQLKNIDAAIRDGRNINADVSRLIERKKFIEDKLDGVGEGVGDFKSGSRAENFKAATNDFLNSGKSWADLKKYYDENKDQMDDETVEKFREKMREQSKIERSKFIEDQKKNFYESNGWNKAIAGAYGNSGKERVKKNAESAWNEYKKKKGW